MQVAVHLSNNIKVQENHSLVICIGLPPQEGLTGEPKLASDDLCSEADGADC